MALTKKGRKDLARMARVGVIDIKMERVDFSKSGAKPKNSVFKKGVKR